MCQKQWVLTVIKLLRFFCINICCFSARFYIFVPQWRSHPSYIKIVDVLIYTPHKTKTFTVRLAVTTKYQGIGFAAEVLLGRVHPRVVPIGPIVRGVIAFPILGTWWDGTTQVASESIHWQTSYGISNIFQQRPSAFWILQIVMFDHVTVIVVRICCRIPNFIKIGSRVRPKTPTTAECPVRRC